MFYSSAHLTQRDIWFGTQFRTVLLDRSMTQVQTQSIRTDAIITKHIPLLEIKDVLIIILFSCRYHGHLAHHMLLWRIWIQILITLPGIYPQSSAANKLFSDTIHFTQVRLRHLILVSTTYLLTCLCKSVNPITSNPRNAESQPQVR